jgi:hypothetical protein
VWPLILIFLGGVFLLQNLGVLPANAWLGLWRLWPLVLVLIGVELLLSQHRWLAAAVAILVALFAVGVMAGAAGFPFAPGPGRFGGGSVSRAETQALRGASQAAITVRFGAGQLDVGPLLNGGPDDLAAMSYDGPRDTAPQVQYAVANGTGRLEYELGGRTGAFMPFFNRAGGATGAAHMGISVSPNVPVTLTVQTGATDARLDLSRLRVSSLDVSTGAASTWIRLPEAAGSTTVHVSGGAASLMLEVPQGVAAQIRQRGGLSTLSVDQARFPAAGGDETLFRSPDYNTAANKVDVTLETGLATIRVT